MLIQTYDDPKQFLHDAQPFLERDEVLNALILGVNIRAATRPDWNVGRYYLATGKDDTEAVILAASITPEHNLLVAGKPDLPQEILDKLAANLREGEWAFPGVNGEAVLSERTADAWSRLSGQPYHIRMRLRAYELRQVIPLADPPPGSLRAAALDDLDLVMQWRIDFGRESLRQEPPPDVRQTTQRGIETGNIYLWDDGGPVSLAVRTRPTPHGESIGGVYTPPNLRGRGYASACVAALSQHILDEGKDFCALFTDLDYPTSNSIYQKIGYRVVGDFLEYEFDKG